MKENLYNKISETPYHIQWKDVRPDDRAAAMREVFFNGKEEMKVWHSICDGAQRWIRSNRKQFRDEFVMNSKITYAIRQKNLGASGAVIEPHLLSRICELAHRYYQLDYRRVSEEHSKDVAKKVHATIMYRKDMVDPDHPYPHIQRW